MASFMDDIGDLGMELNTETEATVSTSVAVEEAGNSHEDQSKYSKLVTLIKEEFYRSQIKRQSDEARWIECYRNYRGVYGSTTQFTSTEKSKAFIKITKTKVQAAQAQMADVLFAGNRFPIAVEPLKLPIAAPESVHFDPNKPSDGGPKSNPQMPPDIAKIMGPKRKTLERVKDQLQEGTGLTPSSVTWEPARDAARKMDKQIQDQLDESNASKSLRSLLFELALFGHGIYKGPFAMDKEYPKWDETGAYSPIKKTIPHVEFVSIWDAYPDADARNMDECEKFIQRHRLSRSALRGLKKRPFFRGKNIEALIDEGANYSTEDWETIITDKSDTTTHERWEVLEYWGIVDAEIAKEAGLKIPRQFKDLDQVQVNAWVSGGHIIRLVFNPFTPMRIPYHSVPYEANPYSFFGIGVAENMFDTQLLMNGFMRLAVDNAALSSNVIFEVNEDYLVPGQTMELYPGKIFRRSGGAPGQAINAQKIDNVTNETLALFDKARQLADESTGLPSYSHGVTGVQSTNRTASGMSMLMGAAAQNIKAVVRNIDDYLLTPLGRDLFAFNMQFNFDKDFIGDISVVAKGTESLMRNEIRSQRLLQLAQFAAPNPSMAPLIKWDYILREYAASLDLDEDKVVNDPREAAIQASEMAARQATMMPPQPPGQGGNPNQPGQGPQLPQLPSGQGAPGVADPTGTGGGNIAPGNAPEPGAEGFTG